MAGSIKGSARVSTPPITPGTVPLGIYPTNQPYQPGNFDPIPRRPTQPASNKAAQAVIPKTSPALPERPRPMRKPKWQ